MTVQDRRVFYFHGFDPASTARYRRIFAASSDRFDVELTDRDGLEGWQVRRGDTTTRLTYLRYDDLVREAQHGRLIARLGRGIRTLILMTLAGVWFRTGPRALGLALSPPLVAFAPFLIGLPWFDRIGPMAAVLLVALLAVAWFVLMRMKLILAADLFAYMRSLAHSDWMAEPYEARLPELATQITPDGDEVLVVGHSLGGVAAIRSVAALLADWPPDHPISMLTLGSVHGIVLAQSGEGRDSLAEAVATIAADPRVTWVDVSNPRDAFCVALTDPLRMIGDKAQPGMRSPLVISAQLARAPRIPGDRRTLFGAMRRHMGYLLAAPEGAGFDYADWVTGPQTLAERTADRRSSPRARMWQP